LVLWSHGGDKSIDGNRPRDAIAVLNDLVNIEAAFPALRGRIDYARIGAGGHSRGAYTVRTASGARVDLAPNLPGYSFLDSAATNQPLAVQIKAVLANSPQGPDRIKPFDLMPDGDKFKMFIDEPNTPHETFNLNNPAQPVFESYVRSTGLAFLDAYSKGLPEARAYLESQALQTASANVVTISRR